MKIAVFTSNEVRHKYVANSLAGNSDDAIVISEVKPKKISQGQTEDSGSEAIQKHFCQRSVIEQGMFKNSDFFIAKTVPVAYKEINSDYICNIIKQFNPDMAFIFGSSIVRGQLLSLLPKDKAINLHLGLSPYYRGSGTNFWPFFNEELEYIGATILHLDQGIDTGDIITHVRPQIEPGDDVHTLGCKAIKESVSYLGKIIDLARRGKTLNRVKQWEIINPRFYKEKDFNEKILLDYQAKLKNGLIEKYLKGPGKTIKLISLI